MNPIFLIVLNECPLFPQSAYHSTCASSAPFKNGKKYDRIKELFETEKTYDIIQKIFMYEIRYRNLLMIRNRTNCLHR